MTDHFFGGDGWEKETGGDSAVTENWWPASFSQPSQNQQHTVIARRNDEAIYCESGKYKIMLLGDTSGKQSYAFSEFEAISK